MSDLIFGVSGIRGIVNETLTEEVTNELGKAFGNFINKKKRKKIENKIIVGRDKRESGEYIKKAFVEGVLSKGVDVIDLGEISTPTLLFNIKKYNAAGGAVVTASHNPENWNGLKFANEKGIFLNKKEMDNLYEIFNEITSYDKVSPTNTKKGKISKSKEGIKNHISELLAIIDCKKIIEKKFTVVMDCAMGVAADEACILLQEMGCKVIKLEMKREIEPTANSTKELAKQVKEFSADIGFATDADGDRLSLTTEKGESLSEEWTLPIVASHLLKSRNGYVVTNLSTSKMIDYVCQKNNCPLVRTKVGEINVVEKMLKLNAILGGEGNGGAIDPYFNLTRDAFLSMARVLEYLAISNKKLSEIVDGMPKYFMKKDKIVCKKGIDFKKILNILPKGKINFIDGLRVDFNNSWYNVRKSNTEPVIRIIVETDNEKKTNYLLEKIKKCVE